MPDKRIERQKGHKKRGTKNVKRFGTASAALLYRRYNNAITIVQRCCTKTIRSFTDAGGYFSTASLRNLYFT